MTFKEQLAHYAKQTDDALGQYLAQTDIAPNLFESMAYSLFAGGKRLRAGLLLSASEMFDGCLRDALPFACAIEMIHTYSLIHDDLPAMDDDDVRRGRPTNHKVFGEAHAILAGDGLLSYAFEVMIRACMERKYARQYIDAMQAIAHGAGVFGMVAGQSLDLLSVGCKEGTVLQRIHRLKTGAMLIGSLQAGAHCAGASAAEQNALTAFGESFGLLFQITDDILDVTGTQQVLGKTPGKDSHAQKLTYVTLYGLQSAGQKAAVLAGQAHEALESLGKNAWFLHELVDETLVRER